MAQLTMYEGMAGSPYTTTTAGIEVSDTSIPVAELSMLPAAPNICTIMLNATTWERCLYSAKSRESGAGTITVARSGTGHSSSDGGGPVAFDSGVKVFRSYTSYDHSLFKANIEDLNANKQPIDPTLTALAGVTTAADKIIYSTGADTFSTTDLTPFARSLVGTTTASAVRALIAAAAGTTGTQTIWVDPAATGAGTGVDKTNAFTTGQAAIDSLPAIIAHDVVIKFVDGAYTEDLTVSRVMAGGALTLQGEYYWYGTNASTKTGKITLGSSDYGYANRANITADDKVLLMKWPTGSIETGKPVLSYEDTVKSVSGAEITLNTNTGVGFDASYTYVIVKTAITGTINITNTDGVTIAGMAYGGVTSISLSNARNCTITCCWLEPTAIGIYARDMSKFVVNRTVMASSGKNVIGMRIFSSNVGLGVGTRINLTGESSKGVYVIYVGVAVASASHIAAATTGIHIMGNSYCFEAPTVKNDAQTPLNPASSSDASYIA